VDRVAGAFAAGVCSHLGRTVDDVQ
jgi:hypothetical protein